MAVTKERLQKLASTIQTLGEERDAMKAEVEELREKLAFHQRSQLAEDIAVMKVASGTISPEDVLDERDELVASDEDLASVKTAMQAYGPGSAVESIESVDVGDFDDDRVKAASTNGRLPHIQEAHAELNQVFDNL